jgi:hypothetical protein
MISSRADSSTQVEKSLTPVQWLFVRIHCLLAGSNPQTRVAEKRVLMTLTNDAVHRRRRGAV